MACSVLPRFLLVVVGSGLVLARVGVSSALLPLLAARPNRASSTTCNGPVTALVRGWHEWYPPRVFSLCFASSQAGLGRVVLRLKGVTCC